MPVYRITYCAADGSTKWGEEPTVEIVESSYRDMLGAFFYLHPGQEVISWGRADEIDAYELRIKEGRSL